MSTERKNRAFVKLDGQLVGRVWRWYLILFELATHDRLRTNAALTSQSLAYVVQPERCFLPWGQEQKRSGGFGLW